MRAWFVISRISLFFTAPDASVTKRRGGMFDSRPGYDIRHRFSRGIHYSGVPFPGGMGGGGLHLHHNNIVYVGS